RPSPRGGRAATAPEHLPYIERWDTTICYELVRARRTGEWGGSFTGLLREGAPASAARSLGELLMARARSA
uniref:Uncharacterized protein n=1 Tax=Setaria italica TaxID=4555 RepID=K4AI47_SETIT